MVITKTFHSMVYTILLTKAKLIEHSVRFISVYLKEIRKFSVSQGKCANAPKKSEKKKVIKNNFKCRFNLKNSIFSCTGSLLLRAYISTPKLPEHLFQINLNSMADQFLFSHNQ